MQAPFDQADAESLYEQMRPDQRTAVALEFVRCLRLADDSFVEQFMAETNQAEPNQTEPNQTEPNQAEQAGIGGEQVVGAVEPLHLLSAQQAATLHRYTFEHRPDCFTEVLHHPLTQAVLAAPGSEPEPEPERESASQTASPPTQEWPQ